MDEEVSVTTPFSGNAISRQKDGCAFSIVDEDTKNYFVETGFDFVGGFGIIQQGPPVYKAANFDDAIKQILAKGTDTLFMADSVQELADKTGIQVNGLKKTIDEYNRACDSGRDEAFGKKPRYLRPVRKPKFYASKRTAPDPGALEGIRINHLTEVLTKDYRVIPAFTRRAWIRRATFTVMSILISCPVTLWLCFEYRAYGSRKCLAVCKIKPLVAARIFGG